MDQKIKFTGLLPVGSVVTCEGGEKRLMIVGRGHSTADDANTRYDYCSVLFPEGFIDGEQLYFHNHSDITRIISVGYINEEEMDLESRLETYLREQRGE